MGFLEGLLSTTVRSLVRGRVHAAGDASGLATRQYQQWSALRHGRKARRRKCVQLHSLIATLAPWPFFLSVRRTRGTRRPPRTRAPARGMGSDGGAGELPPGQGIPLPTQRHTHPGPGRDTGAGDHGPCYGEGPRSPRLEADGPTEEGRRAGPSAPLHPQDGAGGGLRGFQGTVRKSGEGAQTPPSEGGDPLSAFGSGPGRTRTDDQVVMSHSLLPLSYGPLKSGKGVSILPLPTPCTAERSLPPGGSAMPRRRRAESRGGRNDPASRSNRGPFG